MKAALKLFALCVAVFAAAFVAKELLVPNVVPIGHEETEQAIWTVELAFVLRAIQNVAALAAAAVMIGASVQYLGGRCSAKADR